MPLFKKHSKADNSSGAHAQGAQETAVPTITFASDEAADYSRDGSQYTHEAVAATGKAGMSKRKKVVIGIVVAVIVLAAAAAIAAALYLNNINGLLNGSQEEQEKVNSALTGDTDFDKPFYMLLIGSDERDGDASMGQRSDTNILARVDAPNGKITLISIPRDTAINYGDYGTIKFNAAYAYDGASGTIKATNQLCGVKISHYATINFDGLTELVDAIGGVDVTVDERIDDPDAGDVVIEKGKQHLDGAAALVFARSRAYVDGDYTRVSNQRKLIEAIAEKCMKLDATQLTETIQTAAKMVTTDLSVQDLVALALLVKDSSDLTMYSATLPSTTGTVDGASYVFADVPGIQAMMEAVDVGKDPSSKSVQKAIEEADAEATEEASTGTASTGSSSSGAGSNAVGADGTSAQSSSSDTESSGTGYYDPNYSYDYGIDAANNGNISGGNYGAVDDQ